MPLRAAGFGPVRTPRSADWSTNSAACGPRCAAPKVLAGLDEDAEVRLVGYPGSSLLEMLRPRTSSQPAATALPEALGTVLVRSVAGILDNVEQTLSGARVLWLGQSRF